MSFYDIVPIENSGMSVITALVFCALMTAWGAYFWWDRQEHERINKRVDKHACLAQDRIDKEVEKIDILFTKIDKTDEDISEIKSHVERTREAVDWIKKCLEQKVRL